MAFRMDVTGMGELIRKLDQLGDKAQGVASLALYEGARVVADAVSSAVQGIRTEPFKYAKGGKKRLPSPEEKEAIMGSAHGVAKFRKRIMKVDTSVGFNHAGYTNVNFNHMSSKARTNYKGKYFKGHESNSTSFLKATGQYERGLQNQKPIGAIAGAINSGTSFMQKQPFMRKAFSTSQGAAEAAIENKLREELDKLSLE